MVDGIVVEASSVLLECPFPCAVLCSSLHSCCLFGSFFYIICVSFSEITALTV